LGSSSPKIGTAAVRRNSVGDRGDLTRPELGVDYALGAKGNGRSFQRKVHGPSSAEFTFTENIGAGLMKRVGCGAEARLNVTISLSLSGKSTTDAEADLDSSDGALRRGLVYFLDLKKCQPYSPATFRADNDLLKSTGKRRRAGPSDRPLLSAESELDRLNVCTR
jgi:hypothetical protein